jgi:hypothetical protein
MSRQKPRPDRALPGDLAIEGGEEERAVEQPGQRVDGREADGGVARAALLAGDGHGHVGEQEHGVRLTATTAIVPARVTGTAEPSVTAMR